MLKVEVKKPEISYFTDGSVGREFGALGIIAMNDKNEFVGAPQVYCVEVPDNNICEGLAIYKTLEMIKESNDKKSVHAIYSDSSSFYFSFIKVLRRYNEFVNSYKSMGTKNQFVEIVINSAFLMNTLIEDGFNIRIYDIKAHATFKEQLEYSRINNYHFGYNKINMINLGNKFVDGLVYNTTLIQKPLFPFLECEINLVNFEN